jgi:hypothetical protein
MIEYHYALKMGSATVIHVNEFFIKSPTFLFSRDLK